MMMSLSLNMAIAWVRSQSCLVRHNMVNSFPQVSCESRPFSRTGPRATTEHLKK